ncbi:nematocyst expressed protein 3-like [Cynocephalus volans]|uniref:nematocyst expressed protein 3-like n=1 Tax=Cynocephalus volans TaxID=110931 RepID=UPI002FC5B40D
MHPPPATAARSGERRARRRPASGQGPDLAQLQHLPLLWCERGRGTRDAGGEQGRAPRARGGSRRECAAPGPAAPPSAASAAPPARLCGLLGAPPGAAAAAGRARRAAAAPAAPLGRLPPRARAWGRRGARSRALPSCAPRAARATCAAAAAAAEAPPAARGSLSLHLSLGGRLGSPASEEASAPPPKPALGAEHAQCRRDSAALATRTPLLLVFAAAAAAAAADKGQGEGV